MTNHLLLDFQANHVKVLPAISYHTFQMIGYKAEILSNWWGVSAGETWPDAKWFPAATYPSQGLWKHSGLFMQCEFQRHWGYYTFACLSRGSLGPAFSPNWRTVRLFWGCCSNSETEKEGLCQWYILYVALVNMLKLPQLVKVPVHFQ